MKKIGCRRFGKHDVENSEKYGSEKSCRKVQEKKRKPLPQELVTIEGVVGVLCVPDGKIFEDVRKVTMRKQTGQSHQ